MNLWTGKWIAVLSLSILWFAGCTPGGEGIERDPQRDPSPAASTEPQPEPDPPPTVITENAAEPPLETVISSEPDLSEAQRIEQDAEAYIRGKLEECKQFEKYTCRFFRQERLGMIPKLMSLEEMHVDYRRDPFAVKFEWIEPDRYDGQYFESVYVDGENDDKIVVRERKGLFPFKPQVRQVPIDLPVKVGRAKRPVTDFGMASMLIRTLEPIEDPLLRDDIRFEYKGIVQDEIIGRDLHHLAIHRPIRGDWVHKRQDLFFDAETTLPAGTDLWLASDDLDGRYRYTEVDLDTMFDDKTFRLDQDHPEPKPAK